MFLIAQCIEEVIIRMACHIPVKLKPSAGDPPVPAKLKLNLA